MNDWGGGRCGEDGVRVDSRCIFQLKRGRTSRYSKWGAEGRGPQWPLLSSPLLWADSQEVKPKEECCAPPPDCLPPLREHEAVRSANVARESSAELGCHVCPLDNN